MPTPATSTAVDLTKSDPGKCQYCDALAEYTYVWAWGEEGRVCNTHRARVEQIAGQLNRPCPAFTGINQGAPAPLHRDERTQLIAAKLSAEQEIVEVKTRGAELYQSNTELQNETRRFRARNQEIEAQLVDARAALDQALKERDDTTAALHDAQSEITRLQALLPKPKKD